MALYFGFFVTRYFSFGRRRGFGGFPHGRRVSCGLTAAAFPVVAVITDEVCDLAECLVRDGVLEGHGHGDGSRLEMDEAGCVCVFYEEWVTAKIFLNSLDRI
jgi:hypothetical protein